jgi:hypothetical protein
MESFSVDELDELKPIESFILPTDTYDTCSDTDSELEEFSEESQLEKIKEAFKISGKREICPEIS